MPEKEVLLIGGARTPMAEYNGAFKDFTANELGALAARAALERTSVAAEHIDHTIFGNALQTSQDAIYGARHVALRAGIPIDRPALTVNRLCGSGIQAVISAAQLILLGEASTVLAGGMESMSQAPYVLRGARSGYRLGHAQLEDLLMAALFDSYCGYYMAQTAENLARRYGITREQQDEFALLSQQRAAAGYACGRIQEEISAVEIKTKKGVELFAKDDHMRPDTTLEALAKLKPAFGKDGFVTAGNASGIVDGACALIVTSRKTADERGYRPMGRILSWAVAGVDPQIMGIGPVPASKKALEKAGLRLDEIDLIEVNEAFAAQYLAVEKELGLERERTNVNGGAIALGHPLGASGARLILTLLYELKRRNARYGLATACIGGGQGIAIIIESL
ncbi:MAG: acetyl-CoA C-acetyltransferase [Acidobacteriota bacterium]|nr:acetyl-CoA C-acetyltransferase [Blastocatellia bacterium]MDW8412524.1 acetyl-CoA C-acetyltransferase [Acidobacteriota bacterium]